jgi:hypothetical protein
MTRRTRSHETGDQAVASVSKIWSTAGCSYELVRSDCGDDLLVQTSLRERVDPYRIAVQVKGTRNVSRYRTRRGIAFPVDRRHLLYWSRGRHCVLVLWDVLHDEGWFAFPGHAFSDRKLFESRQQVLTVPLKWRFDTHAAKRLAWFCRLDHYSSLLIEASYWDRFAKEYAELLADGPAHISKTPSVSLDMLIALDVVAEISRGKYSLSAAYQARLANEISETWQSGRKVKVPDAVIAAFMAHVQETTGGGTPHALVPPALDMVEALLPADIKKDAMGRLRAELGDPPRRRRHKRS